MLQESRTARSGSKRRLIGFPAVRRYRSGMKIIASAIAAAFAAAIPFAVLAQGAPPPGAPPAGGPPGGGWSEMQKTRDDTRAAAFNDLAPTHRAQVQSIVDRLNAGSLSDLRAVAQQIDALLTPDEAKAVLAERDKMREAMRARFREAGAGGLPPNGGPANPPPLNAGPNGAPPGATPDGPRRFDRMGHMNDAGTFLLQVAVTPERMRALHEQMRANAPPAQR